MLEVGEARVRWSHNGEGGTEVVGDLRGLQGLGKGGGSRAKEKDDGRDRQGKQATKQKE